MKKSLVLTVISFFVMLSTACDTPEDVDVTRLIYGPDYPIAEYAENIYTDSKAQTPNEALTYMGTDVLKCLYNGEDNILISPLSISLAMSMTAAGAEGNTLAQLEGFLGKGLLFDEITQFLKDFTKAYKNNEYIKTGLANSLWIRDDKSAIAVKESYIENVNSDFDAEVFTEKFDDKTKTKINTWVKEKTDSMIVDEIDKETAMYVINAMFFDAEWASIYNEKSVLDNFSFTNILGVEEIVTGLSSNESIYLCDENTTGFVKNYKGGEYGFAVLLPNADIGINEYIKALNGEKISKLLANKKQQKVAVKMPKFKFSYTVSLNETLKALGVTDVFDAKFSNLSKMVTSEKESPFISNVLHKTFIEVAEKGTKAAAVTSVAINYTSAPAPQKIEYVTVDRPYLFMIIDNATNTPIFMGVVLNIE